MTLKRNRPTWDASECALVLIDYQPEMFSYIFSSNHKLLISNICTVTQMALKLKIPVVLSTVAVKMGVNKPTIEPLKKLLPNVPEIDRTTMAAFEDAAFAEAVKATGRTRLVMGGLLTEECLTWGVIDAIKEGYEASFIVDAVGGESAVQHDIAVQRLIQAGAVPNTAVATMGEWFRDWATPNANAAREIFPPYLTEKIKYYRAQIQAGLLADPTK